MEPTENCYLFGPFRFDLSRRTLESSGAPVALSARAFDMLQVLIEERGRVVSREEITARVWPGISVDPSNLSVQMSALRKALGDTEEPPEFVTTVKGRGYRFVGRLETDPSNAPGIFPLDTARAAGNAGAAVPRNTKRYLLWTGIGAAAVGALAVSMAPSKVNERPMPPRLSIVVLPFRNLSDNRDQDYLADAISDDLTTDLTHMPGSVVIARESADTYRGRAVPVPEIGKALNVRYVLEGSVRAVGSMLHVNAQLIDAGNGTHLHADLFDVPRADVGAAQSAIVRRIASALDVELTNNVSARSSSTRPEDLDAQDLFFRARSILDRDDTLPGYETAQKLLEQAVAKQPAFGDALSLLGWLLVYKVQNFEDENEAADFRNAKDMIARALAATPRGPIALAARGRALCSDGNFKGGTANAQAALDVDSQSLEGWGVLARCALASGQLNFAQQAIETLLRLNPEGRGNRGRYQSLALINLVRGQYSPAEDALRHATEGDPEPPVAGAPVGRTEVCRLLQIALSVLTGHTMRGHALYTEYADIWPHRTVWRWSILFPRGISSQPGFPAVLAALHDAGMPMHADEHAIESATNGTKGDFDVAPRDIAGAHTIDTQVLAALLHRSPSVVVLDMGRGAAVMPNAESINAPKISGDEISALDEAARHLTGGHFYSPVVVLGDGTYGWNSYRAAAHLVAEGYQKVFWYRGGEEAWQAAGLPTQDRRGS